jgi:acyl-CoA thioesterase-1
VKVILFLAHCVLISGIALTPTQLGNAANSPKMITILALGDSLTDGFGLSRKQAYPALIGQKMRDLNYRFEMINAGVSGGTTAGGLARLPSLLERKRIDMLILALGINDALRGVPIEQIRSNLQAIVDQTRLRNPAITIIIAGIQFPIVTGNGYIRAFEQIYSDLAEQNHAALVPDLLEGVAGNSALNQPDFIHPNAAGQHILAENIWRVLEPILGRQRGEAGR